ncbi:MAG: hypothetical protein HY738_04025 [Bacteroidia bacterium]|nr:hypothetical protein [Bacteroidia bacterium]
MEPLNNRLLSQDITHSMYLRMYELVNSQLVDLNSRELMMIYEMIQLLKYPKESVTQAKSSTELPFLRVQEALKGITNNISDDIINIEREDRV